MTAACIRSTVVATLLLLAPARTCFADGPAPDAVPNEAPESGHRLPTRTLLTIGAAAGGLFLATQLDDWAAEEAPEANSRIQQQVSHTARSFGEPIMLGAGLGLVALAGPVLGHKEWTGSALRIGGGVAVAAGSSALLKEAFGRSRPNESTDDGDDLSPFSGHRSFPSGHTTVAFALATGIDQETRAGWVPWVAYPAAALVGWSRVRDNRHGTSDVVAGAILGTVVARHVVKYEQKLTKPGVKSMNVHLDQVGPDGGKAPALGLELRF
ncbi:MAG TPA: phosphatase PAP2 family protein [Candidatus Eisenbacteria bacterium]